MPDFFRVRGEVVRLAAIRVKAKAAIRHSLRRWQDSTPGSIAFRQRSVFDSSVKPSRDVSDGDVVKALQRSGFNQRRQEGSDIRLIKGPRKITVPNHKAILSKALQNILRQASVTVEEFLEAL